jgi:pyridoxal phosphate enzyme (YggS family)
MTSIADRLAQVKARLVAAAHACGREPNTIALIAVSKKMPASAIREAYACGQRDFGENYVQELVSKADELADLPELRLHLIGHLQTNKAKLVAPRVAMIESVDSLRLVEELGKRAPELRSTERAWPKPLVWGGAQTPSRGKPQALPVLVEVNVGGEAQKSGCSPEELPRILDAIDAAPRLEAYGLMTVPPFTDNPKDARPHFDQLVALRERLGGAVRLPELSMGMTLDLEEAVFAGATIVRVGTAIFGERPVMDRSVEGG